jgi:transcriptional regulator GlxA family with amidase domain
MSYSAGSGKRGHAVRWIGFVGFEGVNSVDLTGPSEAFAGAVAAGGDEPAYRILFLSLDGRPFKTWSGLKVEAECSLAEAPPLDTIVIPGGVGIRAAEVLGVLGPWIRERAPQTRRLVSVCTGLLGLAASGLMDGRRATTHWRYAREFTGRHPKVLLDPDAIFVRDGKFASSAGVTAGIDLALELIAEDLGPTAALRVARQLVVYLKRSGGQRQYSEPLRFQAKAAGRFDDLAAWIPANLARDLSIEALAARVNCSPRHFARQFKETFSVSPGEYVEGLRLAEAAERLVATTVTLDAVAASVGYSSAEVFRRAFERKFGVRPSLYRSRFSSAADVAA